jgi:hypothetical protein
MIGSHPGSAVSLALAKLPTQGSALRDASLFVQRFHNGQPITVVLSALNVPKAPTAVN